MIIRNNPFLSRMEDNETKALLNCSKSIKPLIHDFYLKCIKSKVKWNGESINWNIEKLFEACAYLAENTQEQEIIEGEDLQCIQGIISELEKIYDQMINSTDSNKDSYYNKKITLISEILCKNMVGMKYNEKCDKENINEGKIFERYKDLYLIISLMNNHYDELLEKGINLHSLWYPFWGVFQEKRQAGKPLSEEEKMNYFIGLINGSMKFYPVYVHEAVGYTIKPIDFNETIVDVKSTQYDNEVSFPKTDIEFAIEGEGECKKLIRKQNKNDNI